MTEAPQLASISKPVQRVTRKRIASLLAGSIFSALALTMATGPWVAQTALAEQKAATETFNPDVSHFTLDNGLQVVVIPDRRAPVVTHMIWYKVGSADEEAGKSGIAHFLEHLLFKGTKTTPNGAFSAKVSEIGGQENAFTSTDYTAYFQRVAPEALPEMMRLEADRMENLVLTDELVAPERDVVIEERNSRTENRPAALFSESMRAALYRNHRYGVPIIGWRHEIDELNREDAIAFYDKFYTPNNAILVVAGDIEPDTVRKLALSTYGKVKRRAEPGERKRASEPPSRAPRRVDMTDPRVTTPSWQRNYLVPSYYNGEDGTAEALDILSEILGGSSTSRIYKELVKNTKVATGAGAWYQGSAIDSTTFGFYATPLPDIALKDVEAAIDKVINDLKSGGVTEEEVARAKNRLLKQAIFARDSQATLARIYGASLSMGSTIEDIHSWPERIGKVTVDDVNKAAKAYLDLNRSVTGTLTAPAKPMQKEG